MSSLLSHELPIHWKRGRAIGKGGFGMVYLLHNEDNPDQEFFVVKEIIVMEKEKDEIMQQFYTEREVLKRAVSHERIVQFYGYSQKNNILSIFLRFVPNGSLAEYIQKNGALAEIKVKHFTRQILEGVMYLHEHNIIHRDIKGRNILLDEKENIKLTDFGISKVLKNVTNTATACVGSSRWMAPEVITAGENNYSCKSDIWSIGCTCVEMITGCVPYHQHQSDYYVLLMIGTTKEPPQYSNVSDDCDCFLKKTFIADPGYRPSAKDLLFTERFVNGHPPTVTKHRVSKRRVEFSKRFCSKRNPVCLHNKFTHIDVFDISMHSKADFNDAVQELIMVISELTVKVEATFVSHNRPESNPFNSVGTYPFYEYKGSNCSRTGSGMIDFENCENLTEPCRCNECTHSTSIENKGFIFNVITSTAVVFDNSEAGQSKFRLFYDTHLSTHVYVYGLSVVNADVDSDRCVVKCVSHDMQLKEQLSRTWIKYKYLNNLVRDTYGHMKDKLKCCVIVSHPHSGPKCVSVGKWIYKCHYGDTPLLKYGYDTATCPGTSGAPVIILGGGSNLYHYTHCGANSVFNYSGSYFDLK